MLNFFYVFGEALLILALLGLVSVLVWLVLTALHVKNTTVGHAKRLSQRPIAAGKNLATTVKGLVQQETVRVKHIGASGAVAVGAVKEAATEIGTAARSVHPEELKPALASLQNAGKLVGVAAGLARVAAKQGPR